MDCCYNSVTETWDVYDWECPERCCQGVVGAGDDCCWEDAFDTANLDCCMKSSPNQADSETYNPVTEACCDEEVKPRCDTDEDCRQGVMPRCCTLATGCCHPSTSMTSCEQVENCSRKVPDPTYTSNPNGCSAPPFWNGNDPANCGATSFASPCNGHDNCYDDCNKSKSDCDGSFFEDMWAVCQSCTEPGCSSQCKSDCQTWAAAYYVAVQAWANSNWCAAQENACLCCD